MSNSAAMGRIGEPYYRLVRGRAVPGMKNACRPAFGPVKIVSRTRSAGPGAVPAERAGKPVTDLWTYSQQIHGRFAEPGSNHLGYKVNDRLRSHMHGMSLTLHCAYLKWDHFTVP